MNARGHLTSKERIAWWERALAPEALLTVSDHLQNCATCREELLRARPARVAGESVRYEEFLAWMEEELDPIARRDLRERLLDSPPAAAELADLQRFREEMDELPAQDYASAATGVLRASWVLPIAAGLALAFGFIWWNSIQSNSGGIALRDAGKSIVVRRDGSIPALGPLPTGLQRAVQEASLGKIVLPAEIENLRGSKETLAGAPGKERGFAVVAPIGTVVESTRPKLQWTAASNATGYRVNLASKSGGEIVSSPVLSATQTEWTPNESLKPGESYSWEVEALRDGEMIAKTPAPPKPEARFAILPDEKRKELEKLRGQFGHSHLVIGLACARAGLVSQAREDFEALAQENPDSPLPRQLLADLGL